MSSEERIKELETELANVKRLHQMHVVEYGKKFDTVVSVLKQITTEAVDPVNKSLKLLKLLGVS